MQLIFKFIYSHRIPEDKCCEDIMSICIFASLNKLLSNPVEGTGDGDLECESRICNTVNKSLYLLIF